VTKDSEEKAKLKATLLRIQRRLEKIKAALQKMEESWDGSPTPFDRPEYSWKPGMPDTALRLWDHYNRFRQESINLLDKLYTIRQQLEEGDHE
jgi:uncharacterized protein YukE